MIITLDRFGLLVMIGLFATVVNPTAPDSSLSRPWIYVWTWLTCAHISYA